MYEDEIATVLALIAEYGKPVYWRQLGIDRTAKPDEPWKPSQDTIVDTSVNIVFLPVGRTNYESLRAMFNAPDIEAGNTIALMGAQSFEPSKKDLIVDGSNILKLHNVVKLAPNGNAILYTIELNS